MQLENNKSNYINLLPYSIALIIYGLVTSMRSYVQSLAEYNETLDHGTIYVISACFWLYFMYRLLADSSFSLKKIWDDHKKDAIPVWLFFAISLVVGGFAHGFNYRWSFLTVQLVLYGIPSVFAASYIGRNACEITTFKVMEFLSVFIIPMTFKYVVMGLFNSNPTYGSHLGSLNYMQLSYAIMPFMLSTIILFIQKPTRTQSSYTAIISMLRVILVVLYTLALIIASTRNTIICVVFFLFLLIIYSIVMRHKINLKALSLVLILIIGVSGVVAQNMTSLPGFQRFKRVTGYFYEVKEELTQHEGEDDGEDLKQSEAEVDAIKSGESTIQEKMSQKGLLATRNHLFKLAVNEAKESPVVGMLPLGFYAKYEGFYPHNIFLELIAEWGIIIGGITSFFIVYLFLKLISRHHNQMMMLAFLSAFIPQLMSSGSVWNSYILFFGASYALSKIRKRELVSQ